MTMLNKIDSFFSKYISKKRSKTQLPHAIEVATCAVLLEIAKIDEEFTNEEQQIINNILRKNFSLTDKVKKELLKT
ncbi:MAG: TerB family tellurite resistance protein [Nitrospirota bacterium]